MNEKLVMLTRQDPWEKQQVQQNNGNNSKNNDKNNSSHGLFIFITECMNNCIGFSKGKILYKLTEVWKRHLQKYADVLVSKLPRINANQKQLLVGGSGGNSSSSGSGGSSSGNNSFDSALGALKEFGIAAMTGSLPLSNNSNSGNNSAEFLTVKDRSLVYYIINTAEYCQMNIEDMESQVKNVIEEQYKSMIDFTNEQGKFFKVLKSALDILVIHVMNNVDVALSRMLRIQWSTFDHIGDQSDYVALVMKQFVELLPGIAENLPKNHYKYICDHLIITFAQSFMSTMARCKRISHMGAQQLLLDVSSIAKECLKNIINVGDPHRFDEDEVTQLYVVELLF